MSALTRRAGFLMCCHTSTMRKSRPTWRCPGYRLHPLKGEFKGYGRDDLRQLADRVPFEAGHAFDVDLVDYH